MAPVPTCVRIIGKFVENGMKTVFVASLILSSLVLSSCALTPASLVRSRDFNHVFIIQKKPSLHALLEDSLVTPNEGASALALARFVSDWRIQRGTESSGLIEPGKDSDSSVRFRVRFDDSDTSRYLPAYFDNISPADFYQVKKLEHHRRAGVGAPLLAVRENLGRAAIERYYPPEAITRGITAVIHPRRVQGGVRELEIELLCSLYHEHIVLEGRRRELAADHSVALAAVLERAGDLSRSEFADLLTPTPKREPQLYLLEDYNPHKEPIIMIHGLLDSPLTWAVMTNELRSVPAINRRYQIWHFLYNTSAPPLYAGRILRAQYRSIRKELDPGLDDQASRSTTLITHSMGGIVARGLITDPGDAFWKAAFTRPLESLSLTPADRATLREAFLWKPEPGVKRVIFIAVPHRGSRIADNPLGNLGKHLFKPPSQFQEFYQRVSTANPGAFTEAYTELGEGKLDSVGSLSPRQPTLQILSDLPVMSGVSLHSIIADRGRDGPLEESSDGVVEYWSSHLDGVASEVIVPSGHSAPKHPETISEVKRLLELP